MGNQIGLIKRAPITPIKQLRVLIWLLAWELIAFQDVHGPLLPAPSRAGGAGLQLLMASGHWVYPQENPTA